MVRQPLSSQDLDTCGGLRPRATGPGPTWTRRPGRRRSLRAAAASGCHGASLWETVLLVHPGDVLAGHPCPGHRGGSWLVPGSRLRGCVWSSCPPGYDRTRRAWAIQGSVLANPACLPPWVRVLSSPPSPGGSPGCPLSLTGKGWGNGALSWPIKASARKVPGRTVWGAAFE